MAYEWRVPSLRFCRVREGDGSYDFNVPGKRPPQSRHPHANNGKLLMSCFVSMVRVILL